MSKAYVRLSVVVLVIVIGLWATGVFGLHPQTMWTRTYGGIGWELGNSVEQTTDGGYIIAGTTDSFGAGAGDVYLIKADASGDTVWTRAYGGASTESGHSVEQTTDGGYIIAGYTYSFGAGYSDVYLIKTDADGDTLWARIYGDTLNESGYSVEQTTDGGYIVAGDTDSFGTGHSDVYLIKTDAGGDTAWTRTYGGSSLDTGRSVEQTTDGGYIVAGSTYSFGAGYSDVYLIKTDAGGDTLWTRTYGGTDVEGGTSVQQTTDGGYIVAGHTYSFGTGGSDVYLIKTDADGDTLWTRTYGGTGEEIGWSVQATADGGYIIAGDAFSVGADSSDVYLVRTDAGGDKVWARRYGGTGEEIGYSVQATTDGGYVIAGATGSFGAGHNDVYLIKVREHEWKAKDLKLPLPPTPGRGNEELVVAFGSEISSRLALNGSTPNPFSKTTVIRFGLPEQGEVSLSIHDVQGRLVRTLLGEVRPPGPHSVVWDGRDFSGARVSAGIYFLHLESGSKAATGKVVLAR
jgi:hypothetical protein